MIAVGGSVVAGEREGQEAPAVPEYKFSRLHRGEEVVLQPVAVDGKVLEIYPGDTGDSIGVGGGAESPAGPGSHGYCRTGPVFP